jgi:hypothetical protein
MATSECKKARKEVLSKGVDQIEITLDHHQTMVYLKALGVLFEEEDAMYVFTTSCNSLFRVLTSTLEYIVAEIWEVCNGKPLPDSLVLIQRENVFKSINEDDELHRLFKVSS